MIWFRVHIRRQINKSLGDPRKQLSGGDKKKVQFPTIAQKHLSGAETWNAHPCIKPTIACNERNLIKESVMMARWLMGLTVAEASKRPGDVHAELHIKNLVRCFIKVSCLMKINVASNLGCGPQCSSTSCA